MRRFINRMNDYAFKRIFGSPENRDILMSFCNAVLDRPPGEKIASLDPFVFGNLKSPQAGGK